MSLFGPDKLEVNGKIKVQHLRPPPTFKEMLEEEKAEDEWNRTHKRVAYLRGARIETPTSKDMTDISFQWIWEKIVSSIL